MLGEVGQAQERAPDVVDGVGDQRAEREPALDGHGGERGGARHREQRAPALGVGGLARIPGVAARVRAVSVRACSGTRWLAFAGTARDTGPPGAWMARGSPPDAARSSGSGYQPVVQDPGCRRTTPVAMARASVGSSRDPVPRHRRGAAGAEARRGGPDRHPAHPPPRQGARLREGGATHPVAVGGAAGSRSTTSTCSATPAAALDVVTQAADRRRVGAGYRGRLRPLHRRLRGAGDRGPAGRRGGRARAAGVPAGRRRDPGARRTASATRRWCSTPSSCAR